MSAKVPSALLLPNVMSRFDVALEESSVEADFAWKMKAYRPGAICRLNPVQTIGVVVPLPVQRGSLAGEIAICATSFPLASTSMAVALRDTFERPNEAVVTVVCERNVSAFLPV